MGLFKYLASSDSRASLKKLDKLALKVEELEGKYAAMSDEELKGQTPILKERLKNGETLDDILFDAFAALREASWRVLKMKHFHVQIIGGICLHQGRIAEMKTGEGKTLVSTLPAYLNALTGKGVHIVTVNDYLAKRDAEWMGKVHKFMGLTVGVVVPGMDDRQKQEAYKCDIIYATNNELGFDYLRDNLKTSLKAMVQRELNFCIIDEVDSILIDEARTPLIISGKGGESSKLYEDVDRFVRGLKGGFDDDKKEAENKAPAKKKKKGDDEEAEQVNEKLAAILAEMENWDYIIDRKDKSVTITEKGAEKAERFFGIQNLGDIENADLNHHIQQALKAHELFHRDENYIVSDKGEILIVDEFTGRLMIGRRYSDGLHQAIEAKEKVKVRDENKTHATVTFQNYFRLYNKLSGMTGTAKTEEAEFRTIYSLDVVEIPTNRPVQRKDNPDAIFATVESKKKAIVNEVVARHEKGQPVLIGTVTVDKSEEISRLLRRNGVKHNILNAKNHEREAEIVAQAGRLGAVTIATNMAGRGTDILLGGNPEYLAKKRMREEGYEHDMIEVAISYADREFTEDEQKARDRYAELYDGYKKETDEEKKKVLETGGLLILGTERHESRRIDNQLRGRSGRQGDPGESVFMISLEDDLAKRFGGERLKGIYTTLMDEDDVLQSKMLSRSIENAQKQIEGRNFGIRKHTLQYDEVMNEQRKTIYGERMKVLRGEDIHEQMLKYIPDYVSKIINETVDVEAIPEKWDKDALNAALIQRVYPDECDYEVTDERLARWDYETAVEKISGAVIKAYEQKIVNIKTETRGQVDFKQVEREVLLRTVDKNWVDHIDAMDQLRKGIGLRGYAQQDPVIAYKQEGYEMFSEMIDRIQTTAISQLLKGRVVKVQPRQPQRIQPRPAPQPAEQTDGIQKIEQGAEAQPQAQDAAAPQNTEGAAQANAQPAAPAAPVQQPEVHQPIQRTEKEKLEFLDFLNKASSPQYTTNSPEKPTGPTRATKKKVGRNDPCPCGSGKKYKDCCYWKDNT